MLNTLALQKLNTSSDGAAWDEILYCCGASKWVLNMSNGRPFANTEALYARSEDAFSKLDRTDWLEAFAHHPRINDLNSLRSKFTTATDTHEATFQAIMQFKNDYEDKFGFIFIINAAGKSPGEILLALQSRLNNSEATEFSNAIEQQKQITRLRLIQLLES